MCRLLEDLVGARRFELPTPCTPCRCATRLRYAPTEPKLYARDPTILGAGARWSEPYLEEQRARSTRGATHARLRAGRQQLHKEEAQWQRAASIVERFLKISETTS